MNSSKIDIQPSNANSHQSYSRYEVSPALYEMGSKELDKKKRQETFDNHGYQTSAQVNDTKPTDLKQAVIEKQVAPMAQIADDYNTLTKQIADKYTKIDTSITAIKSNAITDEDYNLYPIKKVEDVRLDDINEMIEQTNTVYTLGTVTAMTLLIAGIFIMRE
jgi:hypothetical protein